MPARRRITACSPHGWRSAASPADRDVLECAQGFARTHSPDFNPAAALAEPPGGFHIRNNLFKYHAACYMTHAPIEAARKLREQHGLTPDSIARIRLRLDETCDRICNIAAPRTGLEAKFSLRLTTAMALAGVDTGGLGSYSEETAADPTLVALRDKVEFDFDSGRPNTHRRSGTRADRRPARRGIARCRRAGERYRCARSTARGEVHLACGTDTGGAKTRDLIGEIGRLEELRPARADATECGLASGTRAASRRSPGATTHGVRQMASVTDTKDTHGRLIAADQVEGTRSTILPAKAWAVSRM